MRKPCKIQGFKMLPTRKHCKTKGFWVLPLWKQCEIQGFERLKVFKDVAFENLLFYNVCESVPGLELLAAHSDHGWSCLQPQPWRGYMQAFSKEWNGNVHVLRRHRIGHIHMANMLNVSTGRCLHLCPWRQVHITPHAWQEILESMPLDGKERDDLHFRNGWTYP